MASRARPQSSAPPGSTAFIYARVSTDKQAAKGDSLLTQLEACRQYAAERGYRLAGEFTDDYTGTEMERPGLSALCDALRQVDGGVVIVYDIWLLCEGMTRHAIAH